MPCPRWFEAELVGYPVLLTLFKALGPLVAHGLAKLCLDTLLEYGCMAKTACEMGCTSPALEKVIEANILLSALALKVEGYLLRTLLNGLSALEANSSLLSWRKSGLWHCVC